MSWLLDRLRGVFTALGAFLAGFFAGKLKEQKNTAQKEAENAKKQTQEYANTPVTRGDAAKRLRDRAKDKAPNKP